MAKRKKTYLRNFKTGVIFPATEQLLKERGSLNLIPASYEEYKDYIGGKLVVDVAKEEPETQEETPEPINLDEIDPNRMTVLVEAIAKLDPNNLGHFTNAGTPDARAISTLVGSRVTSGERDAAWAAYQAED